MIGPADQMPANPVDEWLAGFAALVKPPATWMRSRIAETFYERECQERAPPRLDAKPCWA